MAINKDYSATRYKTETFGEKAWAALKIIAYNLLLFVMALLAVKLYAYLGRLIILTACILTTLACLMSYWIVPPDRPNSIIALKRNLFLYLGGLIGAYFIINKMNTIDTAQLGVSLGLNAGQTQTNAAQGWITMMTQFLMIGTPIGFVSYEVKRIFTFYGFGHGRVTKRKRMEQLQKNIVR